MVQRIKRRVLRNLSNLPGWRTNRKLVVFESDDWGAIRMSSKEAFDQMQQYGIQYMSANSGTYLRNDGLASEDDLTGLFEVLSSVKDKNSNPAIFTAVSVVANPQFEKIRENGFEKYHYEPFTETLKRYPYHSGSFDLWKEGLAKNLFIPQFHGREHLNVINWLKALRSGEKDTAFGFNHGVYGLAPRNPINQIHYQAAFDFESIEEIDYQKSVIEEGLSLFNQLHGYSASYFIPTNGPFNNSLEEPAARLGIKYMGVAKIQEEPVGEGKFRRRLHYLGQHNQYNQLYITRNCIFESSSREKSDWVDACMSDIATAFRWKKPAVISSHRVNYIGWLNPVNRDKSLGELKILLNRITRQWPDVEFISTDKLGEAITNG